MRKEFLLALVGVCVGWANASAQLTNLIQNGDFETGDLSHWTSFTTSNGVGLPAVAQYDVAGNGSPSFAAEFSAGQYNYNGGVNPEGGGLLQSFSLTQTTNLQLSILAATHCSVPVGGNNDGGRFEIILDGQVLSQWASGVMLPQQTKRDTLTYVAPNVSAGSHQLEIEVLRIFAQSIYIQEYVDNVTVTPVPEPSSSSLILFALAVAGVVGRSVRCKR